MDYDYDNLCADCRRRVDSVVNTPPPPWVDGHETWSPTERVGVSPPVDPTDCQRCRKAANWYGFGVHGANASGCPNCGSALVVGRSGRSRSDRPYRRCPECAPTLTERVRRFLRRILP
ncbi:hypothetical protein [Halegenticoccus soli]|uniref:hypothetical protein n=1 Tax=Halegenticoccus soli TaxID=1985678 RepID=UPI00117A947C|nr:hypothetical protein [Halegenticoccus soli]